MKAFGVLALFCMLCSFSLSANDFETASSILNAKIAEISEQIVTRQTDSSFAGRLIRWLKPPLELDQETLSILSSYSDRRPPKFLNSASWLITVVHGTPDVAFESIDEFGLFLKKKKRELLSRWRRIPIRWGEIRREYRKAFMQFDQSSEFQVSFKDHHKPELWLQRATDKLAFLLIQIGFIEDKLETYYCEKSLE